MKDDVKGFKKTRKMEYADLEKKSRSRYQSQIDAIYSKRSGEFPNELIIKAVDDLLDDATISEYRHIIARKIVESEDSARCGISIPATVDMFTDEILDVTLIALGNGMRIKLRDAKKTHILKKIEHIRDMRQALEGAEEKWLNVLERIGHLLDGDSTLDVAACLSQLGIIKAAA
jgi:hypothetical protein